MVGLVTIAKGKAVQVCKVHNNNNNNNDHSTSLQLVLQMRSARHII
jgi:hypothetical protein